jgi:hypothetical protein
MSGYTITRTMMGKVSSLVHGGSCVYGDVFLYEETVYIYLFSLTKGCVIKKLFVPGHIACATIVSDRHMIIGCSYSGDVYVYDMKFSKMKAIDDISGINSIFLTANGCCVSTTKDSIQIWNGLTVIKTLFCKGTNIWRSWPLRTGGILLCERDTPWGTTESSMTIRNIQDGSILKKIELQNSPYGTTEFQLLTNNAEYVYILTALPDYSERKVAMIDRNGTILELPDYISTVVLVHGKYLVSGTMTGTMHGIIIFRQDQQDIINIIWSSPASGLRSDPIATYKNKTICLTSYPTSNVVELLDTSWIKKLEFLIESYLPTQKICNIHFNFK